MTVITLADREIYQAVVAALEGLGYRVSVLGGSIVGPRHASTRLERSDGKTAEVTWTEA